MRRLLVLLLVACSPPSECRYRPCTFVDNPNRCMCGASQCTSCACDLVEPFNPLLCPLDQQGTVVVIDCPSQRVVEPVCE